MGVDALDCRKRRRGSVTPLPRNSTRSRHHWVPLIRYGWLKTLPADYVGERHIVIVSQAPTRSPHFEWCKWGERRGPAPFDADDVVPEYAFRRG